MWTSNKLLALIERAQTAQSLKDLYQLGAILAAESAADHFLHALLVPVSLAKPKIQIISGFPAEWRAHYTRQGYMIIDPTIRHCLQHVTPLSWDALSRDAAVRGFMAEAAEHGLKSGVSIPLHGRRGESAMLSLACDQDNAVRRQDLHQYLPLVQAVLPYYHEAALRLSTVGAEVNADVNLTAREKECLLWTAEGKTAWEIGVILGIAERTVVAHLEAAGKKLGVVNRPHAVARAVLQQLITPQF